ncbi:hypothetical protein [Sphingobacterium faecium]|uniref:hypothetical protein n=1 Tax=Sphingobacterium faecium TaxID=34087 RepID=UPI00246849C8|nr:hypothetical protein [Sphingobacterium faecium]MDH5826244.1 hypothetical protein [Sphingobacterium faecium]
MNIAELEDLYTRGDLAQCIEEGEQHLKNHPDDTAVLFLMAVAHHDYVYPGHPELVYDTMNQFTVPYLIKIINLEPENSETLQHMLNYTLNNDYNLAYINLSKRHIAAENSNDYIGYAQRLIQDSSHAASGYDFLVRIYESVGEESAVLKTLDEGMSFFGTYFTADREQRDQYNSIYLMKKIYLLQEKKLISPNEIVKIIADHIQQFASANDSDYLYLAEIAFENEDIAVAKAILLKLIRGANDEEDVLNGLVKWHQRFDKLIKNGLVDDDVFYFQLIVERNHFERLHLKADFYYHHALRLMDRHSDKFSPYHFAGTYLHEEARHAEALPLLSKAIELKTTSTTWRRYFVSKYLATGAIDLELPTFEDLPRDLYNDGVELSEFIAEEITDPEDLALFQAMLSGLYEQSFHAFQSYFEEDRYESDYLGTRHNWAMCCNNYGIVLIKHECYGTAIDVTTIGLQHSEFEELHHTLLDALIKQEDYVDAKAALTKFFSIYTAQSSNFYLYLKHQADYLIVKNGLGETENSVDEAQNLLSQIYHHYVVNPDISDYDFRDYEAAKNAVEGILYDIYEDESQEVKIAYYTLIAEQYPHEPNPPYVLMQIYNELDDYKNVNHMALLYLANKKEFIINAFDKAKTLYMIMKSHYFMEEYSLGIDFFTTHDLFCEETFDAPEYLQWLLYGIKLFAVENQIEPLLRYSNKLAHIYETEDWGYDDTSEEVHLLVANALYISGDLKQAHQRLDLVLGYSDHAALADEYKKTWKKPGLFSKFF